MGSNDNFARDPLHLIVESSTVFGHISLGKVYYLLWPRGHSPRQHLPLFHKRGEGQVYYLVPLKRTLIGQSIFCIEFQSMYGLSL